MQSRRSALGLDITVFTGLMSRLPRLDSVKLSWKAIPGKKGKEKEREKKGI